MGLSMQCPKGQRCNKTISSVVVPIEFIPQKEYLVVGCRGKSERKEACQFSNVGAGSK